MDLIRAMGKQAGYEVKITNMAFDGIIPAVLSGSVDVGASGFSVTEERKKRVLFTEPFYKSGPDGARRQGQRGQDPGLQGS